MKKNRQRNPFAMLLEVAGLIGGPVLCHYLFPIATLVTGPWRWTGILFMIIGLVLASAASRKFRMAGTGFSLKDGGVTLVTSGPFGFSRNPIYLAMLIWILGLAVILGSLTAFVFPLLLFVAANFFLIPAEEKKLSRTFGEQFSAYRGKVRRWL